MRRRAPDQRARPNGGAPVAGGEHGRRPRDREGGLRGGACRPGRGRAPPEPPGPDEPRGRTRPRLEKLRFALVVLGLALLAFVSWIFGIMMAVAQDLPSLENREQYQHSENSVV